MSLPKPSPGRRLPVRQCRGPCYLLARAHEPDDPLPTRRNLLERLKDAGDHASWTEFHHTYRGLVFGVARRAGLNEHKAEEALQETFIALAKKLPDFRYEPGKDSFKGWPLTLTRWKVVY